MPAAVMGHSIGEYAAACLAGVFSLEDGLRLIAERARLMQALPQEGKMVVVFAEEPQVTEIIHPYAQEISLSAINGPRTIVISGKSEAIEAVTATLHAEGIKTKSLTVSHAFHSPLMEPMIEEFEQVAQKVKFSPPQIELISNVSGKLATSEIATPEYWCRHIRQPVRFSASIVTLFEHEYDMFLEIGPKPTLLGLACQIHSQLATRNPQLATRNSLSASCIQFLPSLRQGRSNWQQMLQSLGILYTHGVSVNWTGFDQDYPRRRVALPTYPFQHQRYWFQPDGRKFYQTTLTAGRDMQKGKSHPLLGQRLSSALKEIQFESHISQDTPAFLKHHSIFETVILPATAYVEMALAAGRTVFRSDKLAVEELFIQQPLILPEDQEKTIQVILTPDGETAFAFEIFSLATDEEDEKSTWSLHASGKIFSTQEGAPSLQPELAALQAQIDEEVSVETYYEQCQELGMNYGSRFQAIDQLWRKGEEALAQIRLPEALEGEAGSYMLHPVLLDACLQALGAVFADKDNQELCLPVEVRRLRVYRHPDSLLWSHVRINPVDESDRQMLTASVRVFDETGDLIAQIEELTLRRTNRETLLRSFQIRFDNWLYTIAWRPKDREHRHALESSDEPGNWLIFTDRGGIGLKLASLLREHGERGILVSAGQVYEKSEAEHYHINPADPQDFQRLFSEITAENQPPYREIVHLWSLEKTAGETLPLLDVQEAQVLGCGSVLHLIQALLQAGWSTFPRLWLVTHGSQPIEPDLVPLQVQHAPLWGMGKVIALEHPELACVCLDLDPTEDQEQVHQLFEELRDPDKENQIAYRQGVRYVARLERYISQAPGGQSQPLSTIIRPFQLKMSNYGILENLTLESMRRRTPDSDEVEIEVQTAGLSFRDVLHALGMLKEHAEKLGIESAADMPFGFECAGKIAAVGEKVPDFKIGDEVTATLAIGSLSSFVNVRTEFVVPKPQNLSFEEAATLPITFLTAYYGLCHLAKIESGDKVLIHAAAGGVGQAAVQLAQHAGAEVFATASSGKWEFLKSIGVEHVMNSRTLDFAQEVMALTDGQGVDIVLNSLSGEFVDRSFEVLKKGGRFVEIGKIGIWEKQQVQKLRPDVSYFPFDLSEVARDDPSLITSILKTVMQSLEDNTLKPLPHIVFPVQDVVSAFRYMAQAKHIGKVVIDCRVPNDESQSPVSSPQSPVPSPQHPASSTQHPASSTQYPASSIQHPASSIQHPAPSTQSPVPSPQSPAPSIQQNASYLITGGLGALGIKVALWMVDQGAKHLVLVGRRGASAEAQEAIRQIEEAGAQVLVLKADVTNLEDVNKLLEEGKTSLPPLRGIVHAAGVLDDGMLQQQTWERFNRVMSPKVAGAWNLHVVTRDLPLDFFVCFSSIVSLLGSPGQGNYAAANAFLDALAHHRQALGLPGLSINWGPWANVGMTANVSSRDQSRWAAQGLSTIFPEQGLQVLGNLLEQDAAQIGVLPVNWSRFLQHFPRDVKFPYLEEFSRTLEQPEAQSSDFLQQLGAVEGNEQREMLTDYLRAQLAKVLGVGSPEQIEPRHRLFDLGLDSLMAVELKNRLESSLGCSLRSTLLFDYPTLEALVDYLIKEVLAVKYSSDSSTGSQDIQEGVETELTDLDELSEDEIGVLLDEKLAGIEEGER